MEYYQPFTRTIKGQQYEQHANPQLSFDYSYKLVSHNVLLNMGYQTQIKPHWFVGTGVGIGYGQLKARKFSLKPLTNQQFDPAPFVFTDKIKG